MKIAAYLQESPMFVINRAARSFDLLAARALAADELSFLEGLVLAAIFFHEPELARPSLLAETFATTRGNISHCISSLEARGLVQRSIDTTDARSYLIALKPQGRRCALRAIKVFDRLQARFEKEVGKAVLNGTLDAVRRLESVAEGD